MARFLCACLVGLLSLSVLTAEAARQKPVVRPASAQDTFVKGQGTPGQQTLDIDRHWGEILDVPGGRTTLPVTHKSGYTFARVGGMIKNVLNSNPAKYAATAGIAYLIAQIPDASWDGTKFTKTQSLPPPSFGAHYGTTKNFFYRGVSPSTGMFPTPQSACAATYPSSASPYLEGTFGQYTSYVNCRSNNGITEIRRGDCPSSGYLNPVTRACQPQNPYLAAPVPFSPADFDQLVSGVPGFSPEFWGELGPMLLSDIPATFDGPDFQEFTGLDQVTGTPTITTTLDQVSGTTTVVESTPVHSFDYSTNPLSITTTTTTTNNTYQNGTLISTTTQTQGQPSTQVSEVPAQLEVPTDCDFMPTVCSFIDWVKTPFNEEEPDLSQFIADEDYTKDFNLNSNATCPPPAMLETAFGSFELSYEPACMWAGMIKPFVLIAALISAIFISLGAIRGSD